MKKSIVALAAIVAIVSGCAAPLSKTADPAATSTTSTPSATIEAVAEATPSTEEVAKALDTIWAGHDPKTVCTPGMQTEEIEVMSAALVTSTGTSTWAADRAVAIYVSGKCAVTPKAVKPVAPLGAGTFEDPFKFGHHLGNDEVNAVLGKTEVGVDKKVRRANQFNHKAPEGTVFIRVPVTVENVGADKIVPWLDVRVKFVAATGESYDDVTPADGNGPSLEMFDDVNDLYKGGKGKGYLYFAVPKSTVANGRYAVSFDWGSDETFIKVR